MGLHSQVVWRNQKKLNQLTRYSGVAFQDVTAIQSEVDVDQIRLVDVWPPRKTSAKVPSEISYSSAPGRERQWGSDISQEAVKMVWTKMELDQQERSEELRMILDALNGMNNLDLKAIERSRGIPDYPAMDPVDIVADYLSKVRAHLVQTLEATYGKEYLTIIPIDLVITVPAVSSFHPIRFHASLTEFKGLVGFSQRSNFPCY